MNLKYIHIIFLILFLSSNAKGAVNLFLYKGTFSRTIEIEELGLLLSDITKDLKSKFNIPNNLNGVLILNVRSDTDASDKGILPGDIIIEVSQNKVFTASDVEMRVNEEIKSSRDFALLLINRKGTLSYIALKLEKN